MFLQKGNEIFLNIRVSPNAKRNGIDGVWQNNRLKIALHAPAVDGKANEALIAFLSALFSLKKRNITIIHGKTSREKTVALTGISLEQITSLIQTILEQHKIE